MRTIAIASDHAGVDLKKEIVSQIDSLGFKAVDLGPQTQESVDYPDFAHLVCNEITNSKVNLGILICGTGTGMSIAANKQKGIRAALCRGEFESRMARSHNDANVLCLGARVTGSDLAKSIVKVFLETPFEGGRHQKRLDKIDPIVR
jgi:ribose 5-phosphate isomerase B